MPSWKKVITSGSAAALSSITVSNGITGSLFGTASWAVNALTASSISPSITNNVNNYVLTATGTGAINGEANLTFDGTLLTIPGAVLQGGANSATGTGAHAEGRATDATGERAHSEGADTLASGFYSHAEGRNTIASGIAAHAEGRYTTASGDYSHTAGYYTVSTGSYQSVVGQYNLSSSAQSAFIIGNGTGLGASRSNLVFASGSQFQVTGSVIATQGVTASLFGTASWASNVISASFASTASFVNTLNQNVLITGSATIASTTAGAGENTLTLGPSPAGGTGEGGQLGLNAQGGTWTSASMIDNYQNQIRILRGTNAGSDALVAQWNLHTKQMQLPAYTSVSSFAGTAAANLAVDSGGNIITVSTTGGSVFPYVGNAVITGSLTVTQPIYIPINGAMYLQGGDDAALYDVNIVNTMGIYGVQDVTVGAVKLGSNGPVLYGSSSRLGIGTINPSSASLTVNGNVWATSFTGSLFGTSSWAVSASNALTASFVTGTVTSASYALTSSNVQGGAANYIPLWNTATSLSSSTIYQSAGNVGIQNTSSVYPLTVGTNTAGVGSDFTVQPSATAAKVVLSSQTSNAQIGANPQSTYTNGMPPGASFGSSTAGARTTIGSTLASAGGGTYINFSTNGANTGLHVTHNYGSDLMTVLSSGNVGLNTTTPNARLDVSGSAIVTGSLTVTQGITGSLFGTSSWAVSASNALTASFVTGSNIYGPFGSNSILSASFAVSSSRAVSSSYALTSSYNLNPTVSGSINGADYIDFSTNYIIGTNAPAWKEGRLFYDSGSGALAMYNWEQDVTMNIGQEQWLRARNQTGVTITNGSVVKLSSAIGDRPTVVLAQSTDQTNTFSTGNEIIGMATHDIENGTDGFITTFGMVNGLNTAAFTAGDLLWVSSSAGQFTNIAPSAPYDKTFVGIVTRANVSNGTVFMTPLTPIHFHDISSVSASAYQQGDLWMYRSGSNGLANAWINTKQLSGSYGITGSINITGSLSVGISTNSTNVLASSTTGLNTIYTQATGSYTAAFMKYTVSSGSNTRAGEFMTTWNGTDIVYSDTSTTDIGDTSGLSFLSSIVLSQLRVSASCSTAGWNVKTLSTFI